MLPRRFQIFRLVFSGRNTRAVTNTTRYIYTLNVKNVIEITRATRYIYTLHVNDVIEIT